MHATMAIGDFGRHFLHETRNYNPKNMLRQYMHRNGFMPRSCLWELMA